MILVALRRYRLVIAGAVLIGGALIVFMVVTAWNQESGVFTLSHSQCLVPEIPEAPLQQLETQCTGIIGHVSWDADAVQWVRDIMIGLPGFLGLLLGAPVVAEEFRKKTQRLVWTQSVSRTRWLLCSLAVAGGAMVVVLAGLAAITPWYAHVFGSSPPAYEPPNFGQTAYFSPQHLGSVQFDVLGVVPVAYGIFAFALGVLLGALIRITLAAWMAGGALFAGTRWLVEHQRLHLWPASYSTNPTVSPNGVALNQGWVPIGRLAPPPGKPWMGNLPSWCTFKQMNDGYCASANHLHYVTQYLPFSAFWAVQLVESAIFVGTAALLLGGALWLVQRSGR